MNKKEYDDSNGMEYGEPDIAVGYTDENAVHKDELARGDGFFARLQRAAGKFGVEQRGIERVPSDERTDTSMSQVGTLVSGFFPPLSLVSFRVWDVVGG